MKTAKIIKNNSQVFIEDLKKAKGVLVYAEKTGASFPITKKDLAIEAETKQIDYFKSDNIGSPNEYTMIIR